MDDLTNSLTPFVRHAMQNTPGRAGAPEATSSLNSPPLGKPPAEQDAPQQPSVPTTPHPGPEAAPQAQQRAPCTQGAAVACHQKNAADFLAGNTPGVMAYYDPGSPDFPNGAQQAAQAQAAPPQAALPTQEDAETVQRLVEWREEATY